MQKDQNSKCFTEDFIEQIGSDSLVKDWLYVNKKNESDFRQIKMVRSNFGTEKEHKFSK